MTTKILSLSISAAADGNVHESSTVNPESSTISIYKIITTREGNCLCGQTSNFWICLPDAGDVLITSHFNPGTGDATVEQFDYSTPIPVANGQHVELGIFGSGGTGNMNGGALVFYTVP